eukprot:TRINITY_DN20818_c0_g1_i1.p1 TRINITY_DN20818_c0_g1~~TRINITY_DN20818_c0_g1_i1.p1  ORF type:complete len:380 (+),score=105.70 TRINITY_DN20818_c0_g1_i1:80-1141(+)
MADVAASLAGFLGVNAGFSLGSDLCAQALERRCRRNGCGADSGRGCSCEVDWQRAAAFTASGVAFSGMTQFARHYCIDVMFPAGSELWIAAGKTAVNQVVFAPVLRAASMGSVQYLQSRSWEDVKAKVRADFWEAQGVSYLVKPASNFLAFALFPDNLVGQAVVLRVVGFGYNIYYSYLVNRGLPHGEDEGAEAERKCAELAADFGVAAALPEPAGPPCAAPPPSGRGSRTTARAAPSCPPPPRPPADSPKAVRGSGERCAAPAACSVESTVAGGGKVHDLRAFLADRAVVTASARRHRQLQARQPTAPSDTKLNRHWCCGRLGAVLGSALQQRLQQEAEALRRFAGAGAMPH